MVFLSNRALERHEISHSSERPFTCDICGNSFKSMSRMKAHLRVHDKTVKKDRVCPQCGKGFNSNYNLTQHMLTHTGLVRI